MDFARLVLKMLGRLSRLAWKHKVRLAVPLAIGGFLIVQSIRSEPAPQPPPLNQLYTDVDRQLVQEVEVTDASREATVKLKDGTTYKVSYPTDYGDDLFNQLRDKAVPVRLVSNTSLISSLMSLLFTVLPFAFLLVLLFAGSGGSVKLNLKKPKVVSEQRPERFSDVGGIDDILESLQGTVRALRDPQKYWNFGVQPGSGILLYGPPGTGKTLLVRALAGEAGVPLFAPTVSDLSSKWIGEGSRLVGELFQEAGKYPAAIIFIDEIDAIASRRTSHDDGGSQEYNARLNELLTQVDGFNKRSGTYVLLVCATNRYHALDPAITRPGRLSRHIYMPPPDKSGRRRILELCLGKLDNVEKGVTADDLMSYATGMNGADISFAINEAAETAMNRSPEGERPVVTRQGLVEAFETVLMGPAQRSREVMERDRYIVAIHEAGHAVTAQLLPGADNPHSASIIRRGQAGGHTRMSESEEELPTRSELLDRLAVMMAGRAAEKLLLRDGDFTTGASSDIQQATELATGMICQAGMGARTASIDPERPDNDSRAEINRLVTEAEATASALLTEHRAKLKRVRDELLEYETLDARQITALCV